jgi:hypothetical protein
MDSGMQVLQRDGFTLIAPLVLVGQEDADEPFVDTTRELDRKERYYAERYGDDDGPVRDIPGFESLAFPSIRVQP